MSNYNNPNELFKAICDAIRSKTGTTELINHTDIPEKIESIQTGGGGGALELSPEFAGLLMYDKSTDATYINGKLDTIATATNQGKYVDLASLCENTQFTSLNYDFSKFGDKIINLRRMFANNNYLSSVNLSTLNTENVIDMESMFNGNISMTSLDLSNFNTRNVTNMSSMFANCGSLSTLTLGENFDTSNVFNMASMFNTMYVMKTLTLNFNTSKVKDMSYMFSNQSALTTLDFSSFDIGADTNIEYMLYYNNKLSMVKLPDLTKRKTDIDYFISSTSSSLKLLWMGEQKTFGDPNEPNPITLNLTQIWKGSTSSFKSNFVDFATSIGPKQGSGTRKVRINTTLYNALSDAQKSVLTDKGYTLESGTY